MATTEFPRLNTRPLLVINGKPIHYKTLDIDILFDTWDWGDDLRTTPDLDTVRYSVSIDDGPAQVFPRGYNLARISGRAVFYFPSWRFFPAEKTP